VSIKTPATAGSPSGWPPRPSNPRGSGGPSLGPSGGIARRLARPIALQVILGIKVSFRDHEPGWLKNKPRLRAIGPQNASSRAGRDLRTPRSQGVPGRERIRRGDHRMEVADAPEHAHKQGICHRNIKPSKPAAGHAGYGVGDRRASPRQGAPRSRQVHRERAGGMSAGCFPFREPDDSGFGRAPWTQTTRPAVRPGGLSPGIFRANTGIR